jgi:L,D-peptidoglycan transpeptidase YkuD (ErfK/YbiS/YcfS/YnhG family)
MDLLPENRSLVVRVWPLAAGAAKGVADWGAGERACALGRAGIRATKREGDGATPAGLFLLRRVLYRADRLARPATGLPLEPLMPGNGWCDDPADRRYNQPVTLPCDARAERLWRDDALYDLLVVLGHNDDPPAPGRGSAIFLHVARQDYAPTRGCIALAAVDLRELLTECAPGAWLSVAEARPRKA